MNSYFARFPSWIIFQPKDEWPWTTTELLLDTTGLELDRISPERSIDRYRWSTGAVDVREKVKETTQNWNFIHRICCWLRYVYRWMQKQYIFTHILFLISLMVYKHEQYDTLYANWVIECDSRSFHHQICTFLHLYCTAEYTSCRAVLCHLWLFACMHVTRPWCMFTQGALEDFLWFQHVLTISTSKRYHK